MGHLLGQSHHGGSVILLGLHSAWEDLVERNRTLSLVMHPGWAKEATPSFWPRKALGLQLIFSISEPGCAKQEDQKGALNRNLVGVPQILISLLYPSDPTHSLDQVVSMSERKTWG